MSWGVPELPVACGTGRKLSSMQPQGDDFASVPSVTVDPQELTSQSSGTSFWKDLGQDALGRVLMLRGCSPSTSQGPKRPQAQAVGDWLASQRVTRSSLIL